MQNLACSEPSPARIAEINRTVISELTRAGVVPRPNLPEDRGEVKAEFMGIYRGFSFRRQWYYWAVSGYVPIAIAEKMFANPIGVKDIRADGDCSCPDPRSIFKTFDSISGQELVSDEEWEDAMRLFSNYPSMKSKYETSYVTASQAGTRLWRGITSYHIDSQEGLVLFMDKMRYHDISGYLS